MQGEMSAREGMLKAGLENPVKDPRTGVFRERVSGYKPQPGGVRIPSAEDGDGGGQLGAPSADSVMAYYITIGIPGQGGRTLHIDPSLITAEEHREIIKKFPDSEQRYVELARITERKTRMNTSTPAPGRPAAPGRVPLAAAPAPRPAAPVPRISAPVPQAPRKALAPVPAPPVLGGPASVPADAPVEQMIPKDPVPAADEALAIIDAQMAELQRMREQALANKQAAEAEARAQAEADADAQVAGASLSPDVAVNFVYPDGVTESAYYHGAAFEKDDTLLVLSFEDSTTGGSAFIPRVFGSGQPISVGLGTPDGTQASAHVLSLGMVFPVANYTVLVFPVVKRLS